jgi:hypothetical protein
MSRHFAVRATKFFGASVTVSELMSSNRLCRGADQVGRSLGDGRRLITAQGELASCRVNPFSLLIWRANAKGDCGRGTTPDHSHETSRSRSFYVSPFAQSFGQPVPTGCGLATSVLDFGQSFDAYTNPALIPSALTPVVHRFPTRCHARRLGRDLHS